MLLQLLDAFSCRDLVGEVYPELLIHKPLGNWWNCYPLNLLWANCNFEFWEAQKPCFNYGWQKGTKGHWKRNFRLDFLSLRALLLQWPRVPGWRGLEPGPLLQMCLQGWCNSVLHSFLPASALQPGQDPPAFSTPPFPWAVCISHAGDQTSKQSFWVTSGWFGKETCRNGVEWWWSLCVSSLIPYFPSILFLSFLCKLIWHKLCLKKLVFVFY